MITGKFIYDVLSALVPLYLAMVLAYGAARWWRIFTVEQCAGVNRFVSVFAIPFLSFKFIATNDPYHMNWKFIAADCLQKGIVLFVVFLWQFLAPRGWASLDWSITLFSLCTLPNTVVMGVPLLEAMYGESSETLAVQIVVLQSIVWYTLILILFEFRGALLLISGQIPGDAAARIGSIQVDSDVVSLDAREPLLAEAQVGEDGRLHVVVRRSTSSRSALSQSWNSSKRAAPPPRGSNLTGAEIHSVQSSGLEVTPRESSFGGNDFYGMMSGPMYGYTSSFRGGEVYPVPPAPSATPRAEAAATSPEAVAATLGRSTSAGGRKIKPGKGIGVTTGLWSERNPGRALNKAASTGSRGFKSSKALLLDQDLDGPTGRRRSDSIENGSGVVSGKMNGESKRDMEEVMRGKGEMEMMILETDSEGEDEGEESEEQQQQQHKPPAFVMLKLVLIMVWRKLIRNPNFYASSSGLIWSLLAFRWNFNLPKIVSRSISVFSNTGLGMAMFSLGLFMGLQPKIITCGKAATAISMVARFLVGPLVTAAMAVAIGIKGPVLRIAIVQAALPQGIVPFVFAKEYNVHAGILSTAVLCGLALTLPVAIVYYVILDG